VKSSVVLPVLPVGTRVWITWIGKFRHRVDTGIVAANWPCGVCFYEADQSQTASAEQIEEAGSRCSRPGMYRVRTDGGEDVLVAPHDARVLCVPVVDEEAAS
jgi:phosphatidylserine decarboxylase